MRQLRPSRNRRPMYDIKTETSHIYGQSTTTITVRKHRAFHCKFPLEQANMTKEDYGRHVATVPADIQLHGTAAYNAFVAEVVAKILAQCAAAETEHTARK